MPRQNPIIIRRLWRLANRLSKNAELIREATKPHHLTPGKTRLLRHLTELNNIRDHWADTYQPSRRKKTPAKPMITAYDKLSFWDNSFRKVSK